MFVDRAKVLVESGSGGQGCVSFRREKFVPRGGPDGGDGGDGGSVVFVADSHVSTLIDLKFRQHIKAKHGRQGQGKRKHGRSGESVEVRVPAGTLVYDDESGELLADLAAIGQRVVVAPGGKGGRGNMHFASSTNRAPRFAEKGEPGVKRRVRLELKIVADVGLVGAPNAGKSTLLAAMSAAHPKIAPYAFTTLSPNLGVVRPDVETHYVVADIPGLIEGASRGAGLGTEFLRHVERSVALAIVVDASTNHAVEDYEAMLDEMREYDPALLDKPRLVVANKLDIEKAVEGAAALAAACAEPVYRISALLGTAVPELMWALAEHVDRARKRIAAQAAEPIAEPEKRYAYRPPYVVEPVDGGFVVRGEKVERMAVMTDWTNEEAQRYLIDSLRKLGVFKALARSGAATGDVVRIGQVEFEYIEDE